MYNKAYGVIEYLWKACANNISHLFFDTEGEKFESKGHSFCVNF